KIIFSIALIFTVLIYGQMAAAADPTDNIRLKLATLVPGMNPDSIEATPVKGLYEVAYGAQVMYFSGDGRYMLRGNLIDLDQRKDLTEKTRNKARKAALAKLGKEDMIVFSPKQIKHTITVFTDIDCPYCRKLHAEMEEYKQAGIEVRYLLFPRAGVKTPSYEKAVSVWCADDKNKALTDAKQGTKVDTKDCKNPIEAQMNLGQLVGVTGTPAIILEDGEMLPGYRPAKQLAMMLDELAADVQKGEAESRTN
ncbi:MAG: DsbC family protein, partial [Gammaproteobacteria bacterium]|nr:DsbC family protein [Gammaproteobacteria bacterium]